MTQTALNLEPPAATTRPLRVTQPRPETACAAAPACVAGPGDDEGPCRDGSTPSPAPQPDDDAPTKAPAGPRSKAARIVQLARSLGVQSDAEAAGQLGDVPF